MIRDAVATERSGVQRVNVGVVFEIVRSGVAISREAHVFSFPVEAQMTGGHCRGDGAR